MNVTQAEELSLHSSNWQAFREVLMGWKCAGVLAVSLLLPSIFCGQNAPPEPKRATKIEIAEWLRSNDQRTVDWAAVFARDTQDITALPELGVVAEAWQPLPDLYSADGNYVPRSRADQERFRAMEQVLDALIQLHGNISPSGIENIVQDFPAQAVTLFATLQDPARTQMAESVYATRRRESKSDWRRYGHESMVRVAAELLSKNPPVGFAATLLNESTIVLEITVTDHAEPLRDRFGRGTCGDSVIALPEPGWPEAWTYVVEQQQRSEPRTDRVVLSSGDPAITSRRAKSNSSCSSMEPLSTMVRLHLAEQEAGASLGPARNVLRMDNMAYPGQALFPEAVNQVVLQHQKEFRQFAVKLNRAGALDSQEVKIASPVSHVRILDRRSSKMPALPALHSDDPKIVFESSELPQGEDRDFPPY